MADVDREQRAETTQRGQMRPNTPRETAQTRKSEGRDPGEGAHRSRGLSTAPCRDLGQKATAQGADP